MNGKMSVIPVSAIAIIALVISMAAGASPEPTDNSENFAIDLENGWNLVSFVEENTPENMFPGLDYYLDYYIYYWNAPGGPYGLQLPNQVLEDNAGYWVWINQEYTVTTGYSQGPEGPPGPRGYGMATLVVAAHDSLDNENADFVCNGTDDQVEINAAINSLPAIGGSIYLREGTYIISDNIIISKSNVTLVGAGASTVIKIRDNHNPDINVIYASGKSGLLIQNLRIDGNRANQTTDNNMFGIYLSSVENSKIVDCWVEDLRHHGIYLDFSSNNTVSSNTCQGNGSSGIILYSADNNTVTGNTCQGNGSSGIQLYYSDNNTVTGNTCQGNGSSGIALSHSSNNTISSNTCQGNVYYSIILHISSNNNTVTGNTCQGNDQHGIFLLTTSNNTVTGNTCQGNGQHGIYLGTSSNSTVTGNTCQGNGYHGIYVYNSSTNNTVSSNTIESNSQAANNTYDGILIYWYSDYNNIQGNMVRRGTGGTQQRYGISIGDAGCDNNLVINNDLYQAGATADISDAGTGTIKVGNRLSDGTLGGQVRSATIVVAASNSNDKAQADYVCDGNSDQDEINSALNALPENGGKVYLAEGTYIVSGAITIGKSNVTLLGAGASTVIKIKDSHNASINVIYASGKSGLLIQNLRIDGNKANQTSGTMHGIYFSSVENSKIVDCWLEDLRSIGIALSSSSNNTVTSNTCQGNGSYGIWLGSSSNNTVTGNNCQGNILHGIYLFNLNYNNAISSNTCQGNNWAGIQLYSSDNNTVSANTCQGNGYQGILLDASSNNTVTSNMVVSNSQAVNNTYDGIVIASLSDYNNIQGNTVRRGTGGNQQRYGIRIGASTADNNLVITNDLYQAGATADYNDAGTGTIYQINRTSAGWVP